MQAPLPVTISAFMPHESVLLSTISGRIDHCRYLPVGAVRGGPIVSIVPATAAENIGALQLALYVSSQPRNKCRESCRAACALA